MYEYRKGMTDMIEQWMAEEKAKKERPYPDMEELIPHGRSSERSKTIREKCDGRLGEKRDGRLGGSRREGNNTLRSDIPYVYQRILYH